MIPSMEEVGEGIHPNVYNDSQEQMHISVCARNKGAPKEWIFLSDVTFLVGDEEILDSQEIFPAHKLMLCSASPVFCSMLTGDYCESRKSFIEIPDISPSAFRVMLTYIYTDEIHLNPENVASTLYCTEKYGIPFLKERCITFIKANMNNPNACLLFSQTRRYLVADFVPFLKKSLLFNADEVLSSESIVELDLESLRELLSSDDLNCKEILVFQAAMRWAAAAVLKKNNRDLSGSALREILGSVFLIWFCFSRLSPSQFVYEVVPSGSLKDSEVLDILQKIAKNKSKDSIHYTRKHYLQVVGRFVNKEVKIYGYGLFFSMSLKGSQFSGKMYLDALDPTTTRLGEHEFEVTPTQNFKYDISMQFFDDPLLISSNLLYSASVLYNVVEAEEEESQYILCGLNGQDKITVGEVEWIFEDSLGIDSDDTCVEDGELQKAVKADEPLRLALDAAILKHSSSGTIISPKLLYIGMTTSEIKARLVEDLSNALRKISKIKNEDLVNMGCGASNPDLIYNNEKENYFLPPSIDRIEITISPSVDKNKKTLKEPELIRLPTNNMSDTAKERGITDEGSRFCSFVDERDVGVETNEEKLMASLKALRLSCDNDSIYWVRPHETSSNPQLFVDGTSRTDVIQGTIGDCWLLSTAATLAKTGGSYL
ncbi:BTBD3_6 [Lepeophtheirus salmonis]|uniref:BTBD3_6 n=1 Tax=Lepeophtheirus salmonis TaxID=72036 RepID=A0A7R8H059_LEPSM|nr:BTBD3_6 [Lepeophtheirus salmonis]CAF2778029.1 BTBD3_6 [Lepeophtheirus salmonis]